jgi:hypothetical protein
MRRLNQFFTWYLIVVGLVFICGCASIKKVMPDMNLLKAEGDVAALKNQGDIAPIKAPVQATATATAQAAAQAPIGANNEAASVGGNYNRRENNVNDTQLMKYAFWIFGAICLGFLGYVAKSEINQYMLQKQVIDVMNTMLNKQEDSQNKMMLAQSQLIEALIQTKTKGG